ncbi:MAG: hypothetical protein HY077_00585 [Elusimicrobia bacterium]|nr:hypothetical protein [Elusimicrobiota bacterium]
MSLRGRIEAKCPKGCEPFDAELYSFIRGDTDPDLRLQVKARECNLLICDECEKPFFPEEPYIYFEPAAELLAFVFPESFRPNERYWREKMHADFEEMRKVLGAEFPLTVEPIIFFGVDGLAELLDFEDFRGEEREVMEWIAKDLGLSLYRVSPRYARDNDVPGSLPFSANGSRAAATRQGVIAGLEKLLAANDRLGAYRRYFDDLKSSKAGLPPPSTLKAP